MTSNSLVQIGLFLGVLLICVKPLGWYMARVYEGNVPRYASWITPLERLLHRVCGVDASAEMNWTQYSAAILWFSFASFLAVYGVQRMQ